MKLVVDFDNWDSYVTDRDKTRIAVSVRLQAEAVAGWNEAAEAMGVPRTQVLNLVGLALHEAIVAGSELPVYTPGSAQPKS